MIYKKQITEQSIKDLINNHAEEHQQLEFKSCNALDRSDQRKINEIAKDVSSFANSEGGIIIYGIEEKDHKASSISFIDGNAITKEWLGQIIDSRIQRKINYELKPIRFNNDITKTIYVLQIPPSQEAPHMSKENKFYIRRGVESKPMEEYEVRNSYSRILKTDLEIEKIKIQHQSTSGPQSNPTSASFIFNIFILIKGLYLKTNAKLK